MAATAIAPASIALVIAPSGNARHARDFEPIATM